MEIIIGLLILFIYFLPTFVASGRGSIHTGLIFFLNLCLGWTIIGWFIIIFMSITGETKQDMKIKKMQLEQLKKNNS